jgi:hypothetical protein
MAFEFLVIIVFKNIQSENTSSYEWIIDALRK